MLKGKLQKHEHADVVSTDNNEPPVVARLIIEIRSDGTRTIARGAMEDVLTGEKVAIEARGTTPLRLALSLAKSMSQGRLFAKNLLAKTTVRSLLRRPRK